MSRNTFRPKGALIVNEFIERFLTDTYGTPVLAEVAADWRDRRAVAIAEVAGPETTVLHVITKVAS